MRKLKKMRGKKEEEKSLISTEIMALPDPAQGEIYRLLTKREVKMAGYWSSSFFVCVWTKM